MPRAGGTGLFAERVNIGQFGEIASHTMEPKTADSVRAKFETSRTQNQRQMKDGSLSATAVRGMMSPSHSPSEPRSTSPNRARITVPKLATLGIARARKPGVHIFQRDRASPTFGRDWTHDLLGFTGLQVAFGIPFKCDDDMIGPWQS